MDNKTPVTALTVIPKPIARITAQSTEQLPIGDPKGSQASAPPEPADTYLTDEGDP